MLGPLEEVAGRSRPSCRRRSRAGVGRASQRRAAAEAGQCAARFLAHRGGRACRRAYEPTDLAAFTAELASELPLGDRAGGPRAACRLPAARRAGLCRSRHVGEDRPQPALQRVQVHVRRRDRGRPCEQRRRRSAELSVRDTGTGIPEDELPRLFERFHRVEGARGRSIEGSGIGLALVQELVKLHGGTIAVESTVGRGTRLHRSRCRSAPRICRPSASAPGAPAPRRPCAPRPTSTRRCAGCRATPGAGLTAADAQTSPAAAPARGATARARAARRRQRRHARLRAAAARRAPATGSSRERRRGGARAARALGPTSSSPTS